MPVKWLYILKDGTLVPAKASGTKGDVEVVVPEEQQKTAQREANTVVGRVAFWTDDETAKVNINTASEGTYWDTPVANSQFGTPSGAPYKPDVALMYERDLAEMEGAQKEFQRYPGHPATTCLSTIFGSQLGMLDTVRGDRALIAEEIFKLIPRVSGTEYDPGNGIAIRDNSSASGSKRAGVTGARSTDETAYPVSPDGERIYATIDEFLFSPRFATGVRTGWRLAPVAANRDTTRETLEIARFFLSVSSKAPEQNLYNLPRISIWPLQSEPTRRTALDKAIAFCSTVGLKTASTALPFYFTRKDPESMTEDARPKRNQELIEYLKGLTGRPVPGWDTTGAGATTFEKKYGTGAGTVSDRDQLLAQIFDYIRCTNLADRTGDGEELAVNASYTVPDQDGSYRTKRGQVVPIVLGQTRGFGRIATISELGLKIDNPDNAQNPQGNKLEVTLVPKLFCPLAGFSALANNFRITFKDIDITVGGEQPFAGTLPTMYDFGRMSQIDAEESKVGGTIGTESLIEPPNPQGAPPNWGAPPDSKRPKGTINVASTANGTLTIKGKVTAEISAPAKEAASNSGEPVIQTIKFNFPETKVDAPKKGESVIRSLVPVGNPSKQAHGLQGDMRLVAARKDVDDTFFAPAPDGNYGKNELKSNGTHTLRQGFRMGWGGAVVWISGQRRGWLHGIYPSGHSGWH